MWSRRWSFVVSLLVVGGCFVVPPSQPPRQPPPQDPAWSGSQPPPGPTYQPAPPTTTYQPPPPTTQPSPPAPPIAQPPPTTPSGPAQATGRYLIVRVSSTKTIAEWANAPRLEGAWVSIVKLGTADDKHDGIWRYTEGSASGTLEYPLQPGSYEARFYGDRQYGQLIDRVRFQVGDAIAAPTGRYLSVQVDARRTARLTWTNVPRLEGAWVSIVKAGTPDDKHDGIWRYTEGSGTGTLEYPLQPGSYEARLYGDRQYGQILERMNFRVD